MYKARLIFCLLFILILFHNKSLSQPFVDVVNLRYQHFLPSSYNDGSGDKLKAQEYYLNLSVPLRLKNKDVFIVGGIFDQWRFANKDYSQKLYAYNLQFGYLKHWKEKKWKALFMVLPKISSDKPGISMDAYQQGGLVLFTYSRRSNLHYKAGLYYNREFFGNFFMPLLGLEWRPLPRLIIFGVMPGSMVVEYRLKKRLYTGIFYQCITTSYRLHENEQKYYLRNGDRFWGQMQLKGFLNFYVKKQLALYIEFGHTLKRKYEVYTQDHQRIDHPLFRKAYDGFIFNIGLALRIRQDEQPNP